MMTNVLTIAKIQPRAMKATQMAKITPRIVPIFRPTSPVCARIPGLVCRARTGEQRLQWRGDRRRAGSARVGQDGRRPAPRAAAAGARRAGLGRVHETSECAGRAGHPARPRQWPAYRALVRVAVDAVATVPAVLLTVGTPAELAGWPISTWLLLDCADSERRRRLSGAGRQASADDAVRDASQYRALHLPAINTTGRVPLEVAADVRGHVRAQH